MTKVRKSVLWIDDDSFYVAENASVLMDAGFEIYTEQDASSGISKFEEEAYSVQCVILDMAMSPGDRFTSFETKGGYSSGLAVARRMREINSAIPLIGLSSFPNAACEKWFKQQRLPYLLKGSADADILLQKVMSVVDPKYRGRINSFIVHGHDITAALQLKNFVQNGLLLPEPIILSERSSRSLTVIEKFELYADTADIVFVLLTPDDYAGSNPDTTIKNRSRQNVIFELGYFYGKLNRRRGRVMVLRKGSVDIPSDLAGIVYIDITSGIDAAGESIRRELSEILL